MSDVVERARACTECNVCMEVCPTYEVTGEWLQSPLGRLQSAIEAFEAADISEQAIESLNSCLICLACDAACPYEIEVSDIVLRSRHRLVEMGLGPMPGHNRVVEGILAKGNSVNGEPGKRLEWLPEPFVRKESDTLFYVGCLGSYIVKDAASSAYLVLKKLGIDFKILEDEGCCGTFLYECGDIDRARRLFESNVERFRSEGVTRIVCLCPACHKCFESFYPDLLGETGFTVQHLVQVVHERLKESPELLKPVPRTVVYQEPCRLGRGEGITVEPREVLEWCGAAVGEMERSGDSASCCGAGGGVMTLYRDLATKVGSRLLGMAAVDSVVTTCPFCVFSLNRAAKAGELTKRITYFTNLLLESLP